MPQQEISHLRQWAILWPFTGYDSYGQAVVGTPVEIRVRWNTSRTEMLDPQGNTISLDGSAVVKRIIHVGSQMWLGTLEEWYSPGPGSGSGSGAADDELHEVKAFKDTEDVKGRASTRTVGLMRLRNTH